MVLQMTDSYRRAFPDACMGVLILKAVQNDGGVSGDLDERRRSVTAVLREKYGALNRGALRELPIYREYVRYYKRFDKTYQVLSQLESVAVKGRDVPAISPLVTAMFLAELETGVLTAGHDLHRLALPLVVAEGVEGERYELLGKGVHQEVKPGDVRVADGEGIVGTILHGPDDRTPITDATRDALFLVYGVPGVTPDEIRRHLELLRDHVKLAAPQAVEALLEVRGGR